MNCLTTCFILNKIKKSQGHVSVPNANAKKTEHQHFPKHFIRAVAYMTSFPFISSLVVEDMTSGQC